MHPQILLHHLKLIGHFQLGSRHFTRLQKLGLLVAGVLIFLTLTAIIYPVSRLAPRTHIGNTYVGGKNFPQAVQTLQQADLESKRVVVTVNGVEINTTYRELGFIFKPRESVDNTFKTHSSHHNQSTKINVLLTKHQAPLAYDVDTVVFNDFIETHLGKYLSGPYNATVNIENNEATLQPAIPGFKFSPQWLLGQVSGAASLLESSIDLSVPEEQPNISTAEAAPSLIEAQNLLNRRPILQFEDRAFIVETADLNQWIKIIENSKRNAIDVTLDNEQIESYLKDVVASQVNIPIEHTYRMLRDGRVIQVTNGTPGKQLDVKKTTKTITATLKKGDDIVEITVKELSPKVIDTTGYSPTNAGLSLLLKDFVNSHSGIFGITAFNLDGTIVAGYQADKPFVTASTYKMFLAYAVLSEIEAGKLGLGSSTNIGWSVEACIREMILHSTNFCALALGQKIGWAKADRLVKNAGFTDTKINNYNSAGYIISDKYSTASDEGEFLAKLSKGDLLNKKHTSLLLGLLKKQIYRDGIPAGVPYGTVIANKIGFLDGYLHDSAIIYAPNQTYVLAIMTQWGGWWQFAELSNQVYDLYDQ
jgi:beta-lactamase class A